MARTPPCRRARSRSPTLGQEQLPLGPQTRSLSKVRDPTREGAPRTWRTPHFLQCSSSANAERNGQARGNEGRERLALIITSSIHQADAWPLHSLPASRGRRPGPRRSRCSNLRYGCVVRWRASTHPPSSSKLRSPLIDSPRADQALNPQMEGAINECLSPGVTGSLCA